MNWVTDENSALLTDLYELTMSAGYFKRGMHEEATFDLFVRELPDSRNFLIACGLEQALDYLQSLHFTSESINYLGTLGLFEDDFLDYLGNFRFTGEVWAMPEGEAVFAREPLLRVTAPLIEAQIAESFLLNCVGFQTMIASKAARIALATRDREFIDFSLRRDHGADAGLKAARAAYIAGASATSNVLAGQAFGIPVNGTMAHSYIMAFEDEVAAFKAFAEDFPHVATLLIDTFDAEEGARRVVRLAGDLHREGIRIRGVRIDSGELGELSRSVRKILDDGGLTDAGIVLSGDLDEYRIEELVGKDTPVKAFGVGTQLGTSGDAPSLGGVYKLVAENGRAKIKLSTGKATLPGLKQVFRHIDNGCYSGDVIALVDEDVPGGRPLLEPVMQHGKRIDEPESLDILRKRCVKTLAALPADLRSLEPRGSFYPVEEAPRLRDLVRRMLSEER